LLTDLGRNPENKPFFIIVKSISEVLFTISGFYLSIDLLQGEMGLSPAP